MCCTTAARAAVGQCVSACLVVNYTKFPDAFISLFELKFLLEGTEKYHILSSKGICFIWLNYRKCPEIIYVTLVNTIHI